MKRIRQTVQQIRRTALCIVSRHRPGEGPTARLVTLSDEQLLLLLQHQSDVQFTIS